MKDALTDAGGDVSRTADAVVQATKDADTLRGIRTIRWGEFASTGCEEVAETIQTAIGGDIVRIKPSASLPGRYKTLGPRGGKDTTAMTVEIDALNPPHSRILSPKTGIVLV